jgi:hypothetical protein
LIALCCSTGGALSAQSLLASRVRADNDAFDFWLPPWTRPDEEYTSGVQGSLTYAGHAFWDRWLRTVKPQCQAADDRCATRTYTLGQQIFSAARHIGDVGPPPGSRPSAGWLYVAEVQRIETPERTDETSLAIGVTGPPALASVFQRIAHGYGTEYNRPVDWSRQLPFEPGFVARYERSQRVFARDLAAGWGVALAPHAGAALGTVLTEAVAGLRARADYLPRSSTPVGDTPSRMECSLFADAGLHGVARNEFLDGTLFRVSEHVRSRPLVSDLQAGIALRWRQLGVSYEVHQMGPEYTTRAGSHTWASLSAEWRYHQ